MSQIEIPETVTVTFDIGILGAIRILWAAVTSSRVELHANRISYTIRKEPAA